MKTVSSLLGLAGQHIDAAKSALDSLRSTDVELDKLAQLARAVQELELEVLKRKTVIFTALVQASAILDGREYDIEKFPSGGYYKILGFGEGSPHVIKHITGIYRGRPIGGNKTYTIAEFVETYHDRSCRAGWPPILDDFCDRLVRYIISRSNGSSKHSDSCKKWDEKMRKLMAALEVPAAGQ